MAVVGVADQYLILLGITLLFSVLALIEDESNPKNLIIEFLAAVTWFASAYAHFSVGDTTSYLTVPVTWLFVGFGLIFALSGVMDSLQLMTKRRIQI